MAQVSNPPQTQLLPVLVFNKCTGNSWNLKSYKPLETMKLGKDFNMCTMTNVSDKSSMQSIDLISCRRKQKNLNRKRRANRPMRKRWANLCSIRIIFVEQYAGVGDSRGVVTIQPLLTTDRRQRGCSRTLCNQDTLIQGTLHLRWYWDFGNQRKIVPVLSAMAMEYKVSSSFFGQHLNHNFKSGLVVDNPKEQGL
ncbi:hypothetical protein Tco_0525609 [Tanacetum coccineum]